MDTLTHGLAGALIGRAMPAPEDPGSADALRRREVLAGFLTAMLPDADALPSPLSPDFYIDHHRHLTHSVVLLPAVALVLGLLAAARLPVPAGTDGAAARRGARVRLVLVAALGLASHILLDWTTSWGTHFLAPLSEKAFALDWLFIVDFFLSGVLVLGLLLAWAATRRADLLGRTTARASLLAAVLYVGFCGLRHAEAMGVAARLAPQASERAAIPQPFSPERWLLVAEEGARLRVDFVDLSPGAWAGTRPASGALAAFHASRETIVPLMKRLQAFYRPPDDPAPFFLEESGPDALRGLAAAEGSAFGRFARFPVARGEAMSDGPVAVTVRDARFAHLADRLDPFAYVVRYDAGGRLLTAGFPSARWSKPPASDGLGLAR